MVVGALAGTVVDGVPVADGLWLELVVLVAALPEPHAATPRVTNTIVATSDTVFFELAHRWGAVGTIVLIGTSLGIADGAVSRTSPLRGAEPNSGRREPGRGLEPLTCALRMRCSTS